LPITNPGLKDGKHRGGVRKEELERWV